MQSQTPTDTMTQNDGSNVNTLGKVTFIKDQKKNFTAPTHSLIGKSASRSSEDDSINRDFDEVKSKNMIDFKA